MYIVMYCVFLSRDLVEFKNKFDQIFSVLCVCW